MQYYKSKYHAGWTTVGRRIVGPVRRFLLHPPTLLPFNIINQPSYKCINLSRKCHASSCLYHFPGCMSSPKALLSPCCVKNLYQQHEGQMEMSETKGWAEKLQEKSKQALTHLCLDFFQSSNAYNFISWVPLNRVMYLFYSILYFVLKKIEFSDWQQLLPVVTQLVTRSNGT